MKKYKPYIYLLLIVSIALSSSGCATLLQIPIELIKMPAAIIRAVADLAGKLPRPPPGVFF